MGPVVATLLLVLAAPVVQTPPVPTRVVLPPASTIDRTSLDHVAGRNVDGTWSDQFGVPGVDGTPSCAIFFEGDLVVGGNFHFADGRRIEHIARWDGQEWHPMGAGFTAPVRALAVWNGRLLAGGDFAASGFTYTGAVAVWSGSYWAPIGPRVSGTVVAIAASDTDVVVGGYFEQVDFEPAGNIARWNGIRWDTMNGGMHGPVLAIAALDGDWIAGGHFDTAGSTAARNIARWDGSQWHPLGDGILGSSGIVLSMATLGDELLVGGQFDSAGVVPARGLARWRGDQWEAVPGAPRMFVTALAANQGIVHVGGWSEPPSVGNQYLARWNGVSLTSEPSGPNSLPVAIAVSEDGYAIAGGFSEVGDRPMLRVAQWKDGAWNPVLGWRSGLRGLSGPVTDFERWDGRIVAAGTFEFAANDTGWIYVDGAVAWDGDHWVPMGYPGTGSGDLTTHEGSLYRANGFVSRFNGTSWDHVGDIHYIFHLASFGGWLWGAGQCFGACGGHTGLWRLEGTKWVVVDPPAGVPADSSFVTALTVDNGRLLVAWSWGENWAPHTRLVAWDGQEWGASLGEFEGGQINDLATFQSQLCAAGDFRAIDGREVYGFAIREGSTWEDHGWFGRLDALEPTDSLLVVSGSYSLVFFDGATWSFPEGGANSQPVALLADGPTLWVGGYLYNAGGIASSGVARWEGLPIAPPPPPTALGPTATPNPSPDAVTIRFSIPATTHVRVSILDVTGREVARIIDGTQPSGPHQVVWNGRDHDGRETPAGMYFVRLDADQVFHPTQKIVRIR